MNNQHESLDDYQNLLRGSFDRMSEISSGGGGIIIKAHHKGLDKEVIIKKVIRSKVNSIGKTGERDVLKNLKHTCLPQIYDYLEFGDDVFTVMEYIPGKNFAQLLSEKTKFRTKDIVKWTGQLCDVVSYLHSRKPPIIHCDIKPANVMLTPEGNICLIDFNISNVKSGEDLSAIGYTPGYAPAEQFYLTEQLRIQRRSKFNAPQPDDATEIDPYPGVDDATQIDTGAEYDDATQIEPGAGYDDTTQIDPQNNPVNKVAAPPQKQNLWTNERIIALIEKNRISGQLDERTDIYSIGAILYHISTGVKPTPFYDEQRADVLELNPSIPDGLAFIIRKCMALRPQDRFADCGAILKITSQIYRLDKRYKRLGRTETALIIMCGLIIAAGLLVCQRGVRIMGDERTARYDEIVDEMGGLLDSGRYDDIDALFNAAVELDPDRSEAYYEKGMALFISGNYDECIDFLKDEALSNSTVSGMDTSGSFYYLIANCYFENENYQLSADYYFKAIEVNPANVSYYRDYVISLARNGKIKSAEDALAMAEEEGVSGDTLLLLEGEIFYADMKYQEARESLEECIASSKDEEVLLRAYAKLDDVLDSGDDKESVYELRIEYLERSLSELSSENSIILMERLAQVYMDYANASGNSEYDKKALDIFGKIRNAGYGTIQTDYNTAVLYEKLGMYDDAVLWLEKMIDERGDSYRWYKRLSYVELQRQSLLENAERDYGQFKEYYDKAVELYRENSNGNDSEMLVLESKYQDLVDYGWL